MNNLPGISVHIADGGLIMPEKGVSEAVLVIAPSTNPNAPEQPVLVRKHADLIEYGFGDFMVAGRVNEIARAWKAAQEGGCRRVYLMALKGTTDKERFLYLQEQLNGVLADFSVENIVAVGVYADKEVTDLTANDLALEEDKMAFPNVAGMLHYGNAIVGEVVLPLPLTISSTNDSFVIGNIPAPKQGKEAIKAGSTPAPGTITLTAKVYDGTDGKRLEDLALEIETLLTAAGLSEVKAIIEEGKLLILSADTFSVTTGNETLGIKVGKTRKTKHEAGMIHIANFAELLGRHAEKQTIEHSSCIAYIGTSAPVDNSLANVKKKVDELLSLDNEFCGNVQVVMGPELGYNVPGLNKLHFANGVVTYAALVASLRPESAPTNKKIGGVQAMYYNLSLRQLNALTGKRYVTFRTKNGQAIITDGVTTAPDYTLSGEKRKSDFTRLSTLRIIQMVTQEVRNTVEPYIGEPNRMPQYNSLNASIKGTLEAIKTAGVINDYQFVVKSDGSSLNEAEVVLDVVPMLELQRIRVNVSLRPSL